MGTLRRTINQSGTCDNPVRIWVFGGSTVFGMGVPDWATMPSQLLAVLNEGSLGCVQVTNLGVEAYVSTQEVLLLLEELKAGRRPDITVFTTASMIPTWVPWHLMLRLLTFRSSASKPGSKGDLRVG
jgi:hypothetical protein